MNALIGERFLKWFIGRRLSLDTDNPAGEVLSFPENTEEKPAEQVCPTVECLPEDEATPENNKEGETNQIQNAHD